jgi:hypothetical protein
MFWVQDGGGSVWVFLLRSAVVVEVEAEEHGLHWFLLWQGWHADKLSDPVIVPPTAVVQLLVTVLADDVSCLDDPQLHDA